MSSFEDFLRQRLHIPENRIPYYEKWIRMYLSHLKRVDTHTDAGDAVSSFIAGIPYSLDDWQIRQVNHSLALYQVYQGQSGIQPTVAIHADRPVPTTRDSALQQLSRCIRLRHLARRTEAAYRSWAGRLLSFAEVDPSSIGQNHLRAFLTHLAVDLKVSAATQRQAFNALLFLFRNVLSVPVLDLESVVRAKIGKSLPVVLSVAEVRQIISYLHGIDRLMATIIYGAGLRLNECLSLRVKDIDFDRSCITVRAGKGNKDRETVLPERIVGDVRHHLAKAKIVYQQDRERQVAGVWLPEALARKLPGAGTEWGWFWVFPANRLSVDPESGVVRRFHVLPTTLQRAFKLAVARAGIVKNATIHTLRHYPDCRIIPTERHSTECLSAFIACGL